MSHVAAAQECRGVIGMFERIASADPDRAAIYSQNGLLTYGELDRRANQVANVLRSRNVVAETVVAVSAERSPKMVAALFGILKAGGAYLPLAPNTPPVRRARMLRDSRAALILADRPLSDDIDAQVLLLDDPVFASAPSRKPCVESRPSSLIYVIFTSGTTGYPKGVMLEHRAVFNRLEWMQDHYPLSQSDVILQKTPFVFDVSVWELFWWAMYGASVAMLGPGLEKFPLAITDAVAAHRVTVIHFVPSMLRMFLQAFESDPEARDKLATLRQLFSSGEALTAAQVNLFRRLFDPERRIGVANLYGPTEAAVDVTYFDCGAEDLPERIPIGRAIHGIRLHVMRDGKEQPAGQEGELYIAGAGLARGYINQPALTAASFVPDPFRVGERMYRTGDLVRWSGEGELEFIGRVDHQVKIRGLRIELAEIEETVAAHPDVAACCVLARQISDTVPQLTAYLVLRNGGVGRRALAQYLAQRLPDYMIPNRFVSAPELPITATGKTDRRAVAELGGTVPLAD